MAINTVYYFVDEDFEEYGQEVSVSFDEDSEIVYFYLTNESKSSLRVEISLPSDINSISISQLRTLFIEELNNALTTKPFNYHEYDMFLSRLEFKADLERFKERTRTKIKEDNKLKVAR